VDVASLVGVVLGAMPWCDGVRVPVHASSTGADPNVADKRGRRPLDVALEKDKDDCVKALQVSQGGW
jgi:hypothetical protein